VGVNVHVMDDEQDTLLRDLSEARIPPSWEHVERIAAWKAGRDVAAVRRALDDLEAAGRDTRTNVMPALIAALDTDASFGECTGVLRVAHGDEYDPVGRTARP
jgi:(2R)-ethylmalonyl-CoA mutase